jgi:hypothetical protein
MLPRKYGYSIEPNKILVVQSAKDNKAIVAQALGEFLDHKDDVSLYEILLGYADDEERMQRLRTHDIPPDEIRRLIDEYNCGPQGADAPRPSSMPDTHDPTPTTSGVSRAPSASRLPSTAVSAANGDRKLDGPRDASPPTSRGPLSLKDPGIAEIYFGSCSTPRDATPGDSTGSSDFMRTTAGSEPSLTMEEKLEIECRGRAAATLKLEELGWQVEKMAQMNPGFDLRAQKDGKQILIEIKSHLRKCNVVDLPIRQYGEYLRTNEGDGAICWQLWNIENIEAGPEPIRIQPYDEIPQEALSTKQLRVDLRLCRPIRLE